MGDMVQQMMPGNYGNRANGEAKGTGFYGEIPMTNGSGKIMTEVGSNVTMDGGRDFHFPLIHQNSTAADIAHLASGKSATPEMVKTAVAVALERVRGGKSAFWQQGEPVLPMPK